MLTYIIPQHHPNFLNNNYNNPDDLICLYSFIAGSTLSMTKNHCHGYCLAITMGFLLPICTNEIENTTKKLLCFEMHSFYRLKFNYSVPQFSYDLSSSARKKQIKKPTKANCCFNHLGDSDHRPVCCKSKHFNVLIKPLFHTTGQPVCENSGNRKALNYF